MRMAGLEYVKLGITAAAIAFAVPAHAQTNMLFILDGSNSMWGQIDGVSKIATAKSVLANLLTDLPADTNIGLVVYGHRNKGDCNDVELVSGIGADSPAGLLGKIKNLTPKGKTPIAASLGHSEGAFVKRLEENNNIVLISDGIETCEGNPCKTAAALVQKGFNLRVHVVGFDVAGDARTQLECIADAGNGKYFDAKSAPALQSAVAEVKQVAQAAAPPKPEPAPKAEPTMFFFDDFEGEVLADDWEVVNPNPDAFVVEDGELLIINSILSSLQDDNVENLFRLSVAMPGGDWTMTARLTVDFQTSKEQILFGLHNNAKDHIMTYLSVPDLWDWVANVAFSVTKLSKGKAVNFSKVVWNGGRANPDYSAAAASVPQPIQIRLAKKGRSYIASAMVEGIDDPQWVELDKVSSLSAKGNLAIGVRQHESFAGETIAHIDWVKVEVNE